MAEALVSQLVETLAKVTMLLGAENALRQLEENVRALSGVLQDAELRAFTDAAVRKWLADVKDLIYDAEDIIDSSKTHAEKLARLSSEHPVLCYSPMFSFLCNFALRHRTGNRITSVNGKLEMIRKEQSRLNLITVATPPRDDHDRGSCSWRQTDSVLVESEIEKATAELLDFFIMGKQELIHKKLKGEELFGRDGLFDLVGPVGPVRAVGPVGLVRSPEYLSKWWNLTFSTDIPIVVITGMGGVGKTTLAQKIFNHPAIRARFREPPPMWVCVSEQYSNEKILREIIRCAGGGGPGRDLESFAELQRQLATVIEGKKFFLILDDFWTARVWFDLLRIPLESGAAGSKILITTRDEGMAMEIDALHRQPVRPLTDEESWSLLRKLVFHGGIGDGGEVREIGLQIAKKCDGLPLAIKTIAGVLMTKSRTPREWEKVLTNPAWSLEKLSNGVTGAMYLSYQDLPLELKQCFLFCSLFPEDHVFERDTLTRLWVAEGFIPDSEEGGDLLLEDVANNYYNELLSRNLLQREPAANERKCKMHDLLRSLAQFMAGGENLVIGNKNQLKDASTSSSSSSPPMKLRHLLIVDTMFDKAIKSTQLFQEHESLRTLLIMNTNGGYCSPITQYTTEVLFKKLGCLRVIDFGQTPVKSSPKFVGNLIHLRHLDLSCSSFEELPETIGNLSNLQYLILNKCWSLKKLPTGLAKLYKLRMLNLEGCPVDGLPVGIGKLQHLNCLKGFVVNEESKVGGWCSLEELMSLSQLRTLTIFNLRRARGFLLKQLSHLRHLEIYIDAPYQPGYDEVGEIEQMFEVELVPPLSLQTLRIDEYFGLNFPSWMIDFSNLVRRLHLSITHNCNQLPALGQLPNLDFLHIKGASSIKRIGPEFMGFGDIAFPMLTTLYLEDMSSLVEWQWEAKDGVVAMPKLEVLNLGSCHKLRSLPGGLGHVYTLTTLSITFAERLSVVEDIYSLKVLKVVCGNGLTRVSNLPALQHMEVSGYHALRQLEDLDSLQSLDIYNYEMESLPGWLLLKAGQPAFPMLKSLRIRAGNVQLLHRCLVDGADRPKIQHYPQVHIESALEPGVFVNYTRDPSTFDTIISKVGI